MSAHGATLGRGAMRLPIRPLVVLVIAAVATAIGLTIIENAQRKETVTSIQETEGYWASTVGHPALRGRGGLAPAVNPAAVENSFAAVREQGAFAYHGPGRAHVVSVATSDHASPYSWLQDWDVPTIGPHHPIEVDGDPCPQCR